MVAIAEKTKHTITPNTETEKISWEEFQREYLSREDEFRYEWLDGVVEKTPQAMNKKQFFILVNLLRFFENLKTNNEIDGWLIPEGDTFFAGHHRRPDIAFYTNKQINDAKEDKEAVPQFVVEVISDTDQMNLVAKKMEDYEAANVPVIWHVFPNFKMVHVYQGKKMKICKGEDICSADAVIRGFKIKAKEIFA